MNSKELLKVNVNDHVEKKNGLTYLSWAWAWAEVLKIDPNASWRAVEYIDGNNMMPVMYLRDGSAMVKVEVTILGVTKQSVLPVMDHKNKAIVNPDAFAINKNIMRCLAKAISMHGLGLYIYAGEDLPEQDPIDAGPFVQQHLPVLRDAAMSGVQALQTAFKAIANCPEKEIMWTAYGKELKAAAQQADKVAA